MNKQEFIGKLAKRTELSRKEARLIVDSMTELIMEQIEKGNKVTLTGFGTFEARKKKATQRVNPQTAAKMSVPSKTVPKFRPGQAFKDALSQDLTQSRRRAPNRRSRGMSSAQRERRVQHAIESFVQDYHDDLQALADG